MADVRQLLEDWKLIVKNDRRLWFAGGALLFIVVIMMFTHTPERRTPSTTDQGPGGGPVTQTDSVARELMTAFNQELKSLKESNQEKDDKIVKIERDLGEKTSQITSALEIATEKMGDMAREIGSIQQQMAAKPEPSVTQTLASDGGAGETNSVVPFGFDPRSTVEEPKPVVEEPTKVSFISPGDTVSATLLTGVNAPTDGTPYPVVLRLDGPITGPDGSSLDLGRARIIAAAQGSQVDGRALFRITSLAFRHPDGRRSVLKVDGWVVGEDGIRGMQGRVIDKLGQLIVAVAGTSFAAALGGRVDDRTDQIVVSNGGFGVNSDDVEVAGSSALNHASAVLSQALVDRYAKLVPVVEILSGRTASIVFSSPTEVSICGDDCNGFDATSAALD